MSSTARLFQALIAAAAIAALALPAHAADNADIDKMRAQLSLFHQYFEVVTDVYAVAHDPEKAAVLDLQQLEDAYKARNKPDEVTAMYQKIIKDSRNQTLRNVAYMKLADIYKRAGRLEDQSNLLQKALDENVKLLK